MRQITNEQQYAEASERADELYAAQPRPGSPERQELDRLLALMKEYEKAFVQMLRDHM